MKRRVWIGMLAALLIMTVFFSGCTTVKKAAQKAQNEVIEVALEATLDTVIDSALVECEQATPVVECLQARVNLQVVSSTIAAEGVMATCTVSAPDVSEFIENIDPDDYTNEDGTLNEEKLINDAIAAIKGAPITQQTVTIGVEATEDGYVPTDMEAFLNAYTGGMLEKLMEMYGDQIQ